MSGCIHQEFCVSYSTDRFVETSRFFEQVLGLDCVSAWDSEADGRGAYYHVCGNGLIELMDAGSRGDWGLPPPRDSFSMIVIVPDARARHGELTGAGCLIDQPLVEKPYGAYFAVRDPNGVVIYIMERRGESKRRFEAAGLPYRCAPVR
jgi:catechol 2,3-dioxygenase-like lactoylglutathione lyase family enzyme